MDRRRHAGVACAALLAAASAACEATIGEAPLTSQDGSPPTADADTSTADASAPPADAAAPEPDAAIPDDAAQAQPDARPPCDGGERQITDPETGTCYELYGLGSDAATWDEAKESCEGVGAHLVAITSADEDALVLELVEPTASELQPDYWLGGFQQEGSVEPAEGWQWVTGEPIEKDGATYDGWRSNEPNDGGDNGEDCMIMEGDVGGTWDDRACTTRYPFVCERE